MKRLFIIFGVLFLTLTPVCVLAEGEGDPTFWIDPFGPNSNPDDTISPDFWLDPFEIAEDTQEDPAYWTDPFYTELTSLTIRETGLPAGIDAIIALSKGIEVKVERALTGGMYNTICLPFDVPDISDSPLAGAELVQFTDAILEGGMLKIYFNEASSIEAGIPYLIMPQENIPSPMIFDNVVLSTKVGSTSYGNLVDFVGVMEPYKLPQGQNYYFLGTNNTVYYSDGQGTMKGFRAYFKIHSGMKVPARLVFERNITTDLKTNSLDMRAQKQLINGSLYIQNERARYSIFGIKQ